MSWKCMLVGLALILPGTLLITEGYSPEDDEGRSSSFLDTLRSYIKEQQAKEQPNPRLQQDEFMNDDFEPAVSSKFKQKKLGSEKVIAKDPNGDNIEAQTFRSSTSKTVEDVEDDAVGGKNPQALAISQNHQEIQKQSKPADVNSISSVLFITIVAGCSVAGAVGIIMAGVCWYKYNKASKAAKEVEYPAYGVTGPTKDRLPSPGDRKLAQSAQMYHYQHQKQQMIAMEKANGDMKHDASDDESEEDNVEGDYTVYECPGLAPTGEMEVKNPLFRGDETPNTPNNDDDHRPAGTN